ncbi:MAG: SCO family protein [Gammaproteobacteria bacterium]|nr:SCO family protein [Gammaproteobacteria bacterium]
MAMRSSTTIGLAVLLLAGVTTLGFGLTPWPHSNAAVPPELRAVMRPEPRPLAPFHVVDHHGRPYGLERLEGKWSFVFFGYTYCPDICPATLSTLAFVFKRLERTAGDAADIQSLFVSVDPERDTPQLLADYVGYFHDEFTAATGGPGDIEDLARQFGAGYMREAGKEGDDYLISHTSSIFLVDPQQRLVAAFAPPHDPATIATQFTRIRDL